MANKVENRGHPGLKLTVRVGGKTKVFPSIEAAAKAFKIPYGVLYQRLFIMKWSMKDAVTTKVRKKKARKPTKRKKK